MRFCFVIAVILDVLHCDVTIRQHHRQQQIIYAAHSYKQSGSIFANESD